MIVVNWTINWTISRTWTGLGCAALLLTAVGCGNPPLPGANADTARKSDNVLDPEVGRNPDGLPPGEEIVLADFPYCDTPSAPGHPRQQFIPPLAGPDSAPDPDAPWLGWQTTDGDDTYVTTSETCWPEPAIDPFTRPPGTNMLPTIYTDVFDGSGTAMVNTLPSTPSVPYNLHDGDPIITPIDATSPNDDLRRLVFEAADALADGAPSDAGQFNAGLQLAIDILEGNELSVNRSYEGFPVLHYDGPRKGPPYKGVISTETVDGEDVNIVRVHQIWYDEHIEADTAFIDPEPVLEKPWIIEYTVDVLSRGEDDFSPWVMYTDDPALTDPNWHDKDNLPGRGRRAGIGMDQSFFPMQEGTRTVFRIKMTPGKYLNLVYTWGWRMHPPRIQVMENALKTFPPTPAPTQAEPNPQPPKLLDTSGEPVVPRSLPEWETHVFGPDPRGDKQRAIKQIGELSPAKRMWTHFNAAQLAASTASTKQDWAAVAAEIDAAKAAYFDWRTRSKLPTGLKVDPKSDITIAYLNNTIYGELSHEGPHKFPEVRWEDWKLRQSDGEALDVTMYNGDHYQHGYQNVDFGGSRGWENQFKSSTKLGGSGCWFTFGRAYWLKNLRPIVLGAAPYPNNDNQYEPTKHRLHLTYRYEPSRRLRFYQFDPMHHDVAIYSIH